ncbi:MAG: dephospho-CoA kinase [Tannerella sp.]|jgi:dephospho-CoA kinase|nr:dephospho-CoA kinase [Tannerella sp.]
MIKIGITGGIGSGKSVVSSLLAMNEIPVYTADAESKRLSDASPVIRKKLEALFGSDIYVDGRLDRKRLASFIFSSEKILKKVNEIIHPVVNKDFRAWTKRQESSACAIESAILVESGFDKAVDVILLVYAPVELRLARAMKRDGATEANIMKRMNRQMPDELKRKQADFVIINDGVQALIPQMDCFLKLLFSGNFRLNNKNIFRALTDENE